MSLPSNVDVPSLTSFNEVKSATAIHIASAFFPFGERTVAMKSSQKDKDASSWRKRLVRGMDHLGEFRSVAANADVASKVVIVPRTPSYFTQLEHGTFVRKGGESGGGVPALAGE